MPVSRIEVQFKQGCYEAIRYAYASGGGSVSGHVIASLAENMIDTPVSELYCAPRTVKDLFSGAQERTAYQVKVRLRSPAARDGVIGVNVFDPGVMLETIAVGTIDGWPWGDACTPFRG
jgi:hypothetical protein